jgi:hypothetical protein
VPPIWPAPISAIFLRDISTGGAWWLIVAEVDPAPPL